MSDQNAPIAAAEVRALFASFAAAPALILAVSGGPDSVALLWLAARWRRSLRKGPALIAATIDHGLRKESAGEARAVKRLAESLAVVHVTKRWRGPKPTTGIPAAARAARYALLARAAKSARATHILTAHTQDDQAETVLMRLAKGSGVEGLAGMAAATPLGSVTLARPFLGIGKARLIATLDRAKIAYATDPTNSDPAYLRPRLRVLMPNLAAEGLGARRLSRLAARMARADAALQAMTDVAERSGAARTGAFHALPEDIRIRLLQRAIGRVATEGHLGLAQIEVLAAAIADAARQGRSLRRTLAGALISAGETGVVVTAAPPRRVAQD